MSIPISNCLLQFFLKCFCCSDESNQKAIRDHSSKVEINLFHIFVHIDVSVGTGSMGVGFVWLDRSKCGSERIGREEEGTRSGKAEMGSYVAILRHTPDHEDLLTVTYRQ